MTQDVSPTAAPGKPGLMVSPLKVAFPTLPPIKGAEMATGRAGFYKHERSDVLVMRFSEGTSCGGVFTQHKVGSAPVDFCREGLAKTGGDNVRGLLVNAGCANAFTGKLGADAAARSAAAVASALGISPGQMMIASTGVIGVVLKDEKISAIVPDLVSRLGTDGWAEAGATIMTTDTFPKGATATATIEGVRVTLNGIAKGSGMIAPNMATMLGFVVTDAAISAPVLTALVKRLTISTFNAVTVDGDASTNDTLLVFATGQSGASLISDVTDPRLGDFAQKLEAVLLDLAQQLVRDGEGATKFVHVRVTGAKDDASAQVLARSIADSPLVKTAIAGEDANWGRIVMAVGKTPEPVNRDALKITFGPLIAAIDGAPSPTYDETAMSAYMKNQELEIAVDVGLGTGAASVYTCDLTKRYIEINADYRS